VAEPLGDLGERELEVGSGSSSARIGAPRRRSVTTEEAARTIERRREKAETAFMEPPTVMTVRE
jgi:hypothetical protein